MSVAEIVENTSIGHMYVPIGSIVPSKTNPRTHFDKLKLEELAESIAKHGIVQPLVLRPMGDAFEIVCGERRYRAAQIVPLERVPAVVREMNDKEALEVQVIENLQRADLHPLEEAEGYAKLMREHGYDADTLAAKIGKSRSYVYGRMKLADLTKKGKDALWKDDIHHSTALLIARLPNDRQDEALEAILDEGMTYRAAREYLESEFFLRLVDAAWRLDDAQLVPAAGPCTTCPFRSGNQKDLFGDVAKNADVCTKPDCYQDKADAFWQRVKTQAEAGGARILPDDLHEKVFETYGHLKRGSGYVRADDTCNEDSRYRNYGAIVGKSVKAILARDPRGKVVRLYAEQELKPVLKEKGVTGAARASALGENTWQRSQRIRQEKAKVDRAVEGAIVAELRPKLEKLPLSVETLRIFTRAIAVDRYFHLEKWLKDHGAPALNYNNREKVITGLVNKMKTAGELFSVIAEALLKFSPTEMRSESEKGMAAELCKLVKIDAGAIEKRIRGEAAAKKRAKTVKKTKATKKAKARK